MHESPTDVAQAVARHVLIRLHEVQRERGEATLVLTGGSMGIAALQETASHELCRSVDWRRVNIWWGDERFLPSDHPDRNHVQAKAALLDHVMLDPARIHPMGSTGTFDDVDMAAASYAAELIKDASRSGKDELPTLDVLLLGVGPDAHIASLFPELGAIRVTGTAVVGVRDSPKPPTERVSLTLDTITSADDVVLAVAGENKAGAVGLALAGASPIQVPAAGARGTRRTLWMIDRQAAAQVPTALLP
nr:6-phosphogluconolactonase [Arthrobacter roseus]